MWEINKCLNATNATKAERRSYKKILKGNARQRKVLGYRMFRTAVSQILERENSTMDLNKTTRHYWKMCNGNQDGVLTMWEIKKCMNASGDSKADQKANLKILRNNTKTQTVLGYKDFKKSVQEIHMAS